MQVGEKAIDYNEGFKLYLVTRNPAPVVTPDVVAVVTRVNFSITKSGLEEQVKGAQDTAPCVCFRCLTMTQPLPCVFLLPFVAMTPPLPRVFRCR